MKGNRYVMVGLGEVVWDLLPTGKELGGAPANFAYYAEKLGNQGIIASRVGSDPLGQELLQRLKGQGLATEHIQMDPQRATATVRVQVDSRGQPHFTLDKEIAWDFLEWTPEWEDLAARADAVCFGTVVQRSSPSRQTVRRFLEATPPAAPRFYDVNLREGFHPKAILEESLKLATVAKLTSQELSQITALLKLGSGDEEEYARRLIDAYSPDLVCVTRGAAGSLLVTASENALHLGFPQEVVDTVGAGDAFTAAVAHHYLRHSPLERMSEAANLLASWVTTRAGAVHPIDKDILRRVV